MDFSLLVVTLFLGRVTAIGFITWVVKRQLDLFKLPIDENLRHFRRKLFALSMTLFASNLVPAVIDALVLLDEVAKSKGATGYGVVYTLSNMITSVVSAYIVWLLYREAKRHTGTESL